MPPTKTDTGHGALWDIFPERSQAIHGGARFDEGFNLQSKGAPNGPSFDEFRPSTKPDGNHGQLWDEWSWKDMPDLHGGLLYDNGFASQTANTSSQGPLFDLFQPSTQVKFIYDGKDSEGIVDHVDGEDVFVRQRGSANVVPVGLSQFLAFRSPSLDNTATVAERSEAEAPSAWSPGAHGAEREAGEPYGQPVMSTPQGQAMQERSGVPEGSMNIVDQLKSMFDPNDVQKEHVGFAEMIKKLEGQGHSNEKAKAIAASIGRKKFGEKGMEDKAEAAKSFRLPSELLKSCSVWSGVTSVAKEITVADAAIQAEEGAAPFSGKKGAGSYCPECRVNVKPSEDGRCPTCQMALKAHEGHKIVPREKGDGNGSAEDSAGKGVAEKTFPEMDIANLEHHEQHSVPHAGIMGLRRMKVAKTSIVDDLRKAFGAGGDPMPGGQTVTLTGKPEQKDSNKGHAKSDPSGPMVPERTHAESDHNEDKSQPRTCPHCGEPLKELDDKTAEGAPSNVEPDVAHKCLEGLMDTFKIREEPVSSLDSLRRLVAA